MNITAAKRKRALLLHYAGTDVDEIFDTLPNTGEDGDYDTAVAKLNEYFSPQVNTTYEVYNFRQTKQKEGESLDSFHTRLRQLAKTCEFSDVDKEIKEHIILTCSSSSLRRRALRENPTLEGLLNLGRALELSEKQAKDVEDTGGEFQAVNKIKRKEENRQSRPRDRRDTQSRNRRFGNKQGKSPRKCGKCGGYAPHKNPCPAQGKVCKACGKIGHFAHVCRSKPRTVASVETGQTSDEEYEYAYTVDHQENKKPPICQLQINGRNVNMMIDSGASVNLLDEITFQRINSHGSESLQPVHTKIYSYGSKVPLPTLGILTATVKSSNASTSAQLTVVKGENGNLLSYHTAKKLGLIVVSINTATVTERNKDDPESLKEEFKSLFGGIGKVPNKQVKLHIDPDVTPRQQPHRRIPFHVRDDVEKELERLEKLDIIEKVEGPTPWISPIVVVPKKSGEVRICVDMREANQAIKREKHLMPTIDDLVADLNGATLFSTLDLSSGYHQLELSPESRYVTTFSTHAGLRRYKRLPFGINAASEIFQEKIRELLSGLPGCKNISDDIIVFGKDQEEHNKNLRGVLQRLKENNLRLNKDKCAFSKTEIKFYGHIFSSVGVRPDPKKVKAIHEAQPPRNHSELKSSLGMAQYVSRFIPDYATITTPLRLLTRQDTPWKWEQEEQKALDKLKEALAGDQVMSYFDPRKKTEIIVDASPTGLGGLLVQEGKILSYASRALSDVESRYSQTEREMLAVVWGVEHFHLYVYGAQFSVVTDHKPLIGIFKNHKQTSPRMDRWKLRLMPYDCQLIYRPGRDAENPADYMSRHPCPTAPEEQNLAEDYANYVCSNAVPRAMTLEEIKHETRNDAEMQAVVKAVETGQWNVPDVQKYKKLKEELSVFNGLVLRRNRIVIPFTLRSKAVDLAHGGHQGIVKTKQLIRDKVWFPGIDNLTEEKVKSCLSCQAASTKSPPIEPLRMTSLPSGPWREVAVDFAGPFPSGDYIMVVTDEFSRFPEVEILTSTSAKVVIPKLDAIFSRQGIPDVLKSDNGPPFNGHEFKNFSDYLGFKHRRITPYWPRANGEAERLVQTLQKSIRIAHLEGKNWKQELYKFLRQYRATPHSTINVSPSEALNNRKLKTTIPESPITQHKLPRYTLQDPSASIAQRDALQKQKMKVYGDLKAHAQEREIKPGEVVLIRQPKQNKLSTPYNPKPFIVEEQKGTMVTASDGSHTVTRNSSQFKVIPKHLAPCQENGGRKDEEKTQCPSEMKADALPRRSKRQIKPPVRFSDYVQIVYEK